MKQIDWDVIRKNERKTRDENELSVFLQEDRTN